MRKAFPILVRVRYSCAKCPAYCCSYPEIEVTPHGHRATGAALRPRLRAGRRTLHPLRRGAESAAAAPPQGPDLRFGVRPARPGHAPLHGIRVASRGLPRISRQRALRLLRFPEVRARAPGRSRVHRLDLSAFSRIAESVVDGVMASGSMRSSRIAGLPEVLARSNAGAKSSVRSTTAPCAPNARA